MVQPGFRVAGFSDKNCPPVHQRFANQQPIDRVFAHQQNPAALQFGAGRPERRLGLCGLDAERRREAEGAAVSGRAFGRHCSPHPVNHLTADSKAQPAAAVASGDRRIRLGKTVEDKRQLVGGYPNPRVRDREPEGACLARWRPFRLDGQTDGAGAGEFDCVANEVRQNGAELVRIADQAIGCAGLDSK